MKRVQRDGQRVTCTPEAGKTRPERRAGRAVYPLPAVHPESLQTGEEAAQAVRRHEYEPRADRSRDAQRAARRPGARIAIWRVCKYSSLRERERGRESEKKSFKSKYSY